MLFANRARRGQDRFLAWKTVLLLAGMGLGLLGISLENRWIVSGAILVLMVGVVLRFVTPRGSD